MAEKAKKTKETAKEVKSLEDLEKELLTKRNDLVEAKRSHAAGELVNPRVLAAYRKDIARLLTEINERKSNG